MNLTAHDLYDEGNGKIAIGDIQGKDQVSQLRPKLLMGGETMAWH